MAFVFEVNGVVAAETGVAETAVVAVEASVHSLEAEIGQRIGADIFAARLDRMERGKKRRQ